MKPLSPLKFFIENKKKSAVIFAIMLLSVAVVSFITSMIASIFIDGLNANLKPFEYCSIIYKTSEDIFIKDSISEEVKGYPETGKTISVLINNTSFNSLMGNSSVPICFIENENELKEVLDISHITLSEGRLPHGDEYEIALNEKVLKNKNLLIGDFIGDDVQEDEWLSGKYKIVGVLQGESLIGVGNKNISTETYKNAGLSLDKPMALLIIPKEGKLDALNERLDKIDKKDAAVNNYSSLKRMLDNQISSMNALLQMIIFAVVFVLSISVGALVYIIYMGRSDEFGILYAMGYRKGFINRLILKELVSLSVVGWGIGYLFSMLVIFAINAAFLDSKGQTLYFFTTEGLINTLFIPILLVICASFPILRKLKKWDPISVIERRD